MKAFTLAYKEYCKARGNLCAVIATSFPIRSHVNYGHGSHEREGVVIDHSGERVKIVSPGAKQLWIHAWRITSVRK